MSGENNATKALAAIMAEANTKHPSRARVMELCRQGLSPPLLWRGRADAPPPPGPLGRMVRERVPLGFTISVLTVIVMVGGVFFEIGRALWRAIVG